VCRTGLASTLQRRADDMAPVASYVCSGRLEQRNAPAAPAPALAAPKAGVDEAPKPPKAGVLLAPKSGVLAAPKAGELPKREGLLCWAKAAALLAPKSDVVAPKAGVLPAEKGLLNAIDRDWNQVLACMINVRIQLIVTG